MYQVNKPQKGFNKVCLGVGFSVLFFWLFTASFLARAEQKGMQVYIIPHPTAKHIGILPHTFPIPGNTSNELFIVASPGEYEPASFVVRAPSEGIKSLKLEVSPLRGEKGTIPPEYVDIRVVKAWFQNRSSGWPDNAMCLAGVKDGDRVLVPELLLNDASLVKVDKENKNNYLRLDFPDGPRFIPISLEGGIPGIGPSPTVEEFPLRDSPILSPVDIPANSNQQFWLTLRVPEDMQPGVYE